MGSDAVVLGKRCIDCLERAALRPPPRIVDTITYFDTSDLITFLDENGALDNLPIERDDLTVEYCLNWCRDAILHSPDNLYIFSLKQRRHIPFKLQRALHSLAENTRGNMSVPVRHIQNLRAQKPIL